MVYPKHILKTTEPVSIADLKVMSSEKFQRLVLKAFNRLGYSVWLNEKKGADKGITRSILLKDGERYLIYSGNAKDLVDMSLIRNFSRDLEKENIESGSFITTDLITLEGRTYFQERELNFIDADKLLLFFKVIFGETGIKEEVNRVFERRKSLRIDQRMLWEDKVVQRASTLYGADLRVKGIGNIAREGISFTVADKISNSSLLKLELSLPAETDIIKTMVKVIWQNQEANSLDHKLGCMFFLIGDKDKERIFNFIESRSFLESFQSASKIPENRNDFGLTPKILLKSLVERKIFGEKKDNPIRRIREVDIKKAEAAVKSFFKKMFSEKCKILEVNKTSEGWEALAMKIDSWFEKQGYRDVYEKTAYVVRLDNKFKVLSYSKRGEDSASKTANSLDADKVREIVKGVMEEVSDNTARSAEKIAQEVTKAISIPEGTRDILKKALLEAVSEVEQRKTSLFQKKEEEEIKIKEDYISPLKKIKVERSFKRIGKVKQSKKKIKNQIKSLQGIKKKKVKTKKEK